LGIEERERGDRWKERGVEKEIERITEREIITERETETEDRQRQLVYIYRQLINNGRIQASLRHNRPLYIIYAAVKHHHEYTRLTREVQRERDKQTDGEKERRKERQTERDEEIGRWMDGWMDGWIDR